MVMNSASLKEIRSELQALDADQLQEMCQRLAKYKKENKELLTYLLFEAHDEQAYITHVKEEVESLFEDLPKGNVYYIKKNLRKILRFVNRQVKYSGIPRTELEVRIFFCVKIREANVPIHSNTVLGNLYRQQTKKIESILAKLPEDLQMDYDREITTILKGL
jgi:hypothetical protein